jgi:hypothetical protein
MSEEKPSPEPWAIDSEGRIRDAAGDVVCPLPVGWERDPVRRAQAALIADAPAMLDLLRRVDEAEKHAEEFEDRSTLAGQLIAETRALLDKHGRG